MCSSSLTILAHLHDNNVCLESPNWTQCSSCGLTSDEWRGRITSLDLWAALLLMKLSVCLAIFTARTCCWLLGTLLATRTIRSFSPRWLSSQTQVVLASYQGGMDRRCRGLGRAQRVRSRLSLKMHGLEDQTGCELGHVVLPATAITHQGLAFLFENVKTVNNREVRWL